MSQISLPLDIQTLNITSQRINNKGGMRSGTLNTYFPLASSL